MLYIWIILGVDVGTYSSTMGLWIYRLVNVHITMKDHLKQKTVNAILNSYVKLPDGMFQIYCSATISCTGKLQ